MSRQDLGDMEDIDEYSGYADSSDYDDSGFQPKPKPTPKPRPMSKPQPQPVDMPVPRPESNSFNDEPEVKLPKNVNWGSFKSVVEEVNRGIATIGTYKLAIEKGKKIIETSLNDFTREASGYLHEFTTIKKAKYIEQHLTTAYTELTNSCVNVCEDVLLERDEVINIKAKLLVMDRYIELIEQSEEGNYSKEQRALLNTAKSLSETVLEKIETANDNYTYLEDFYVVNCKTRYNKVMNKYKQLFNRLASEESHVEIDKRVENEYREHVLNEERQRVVNEQLDLFNSGSGYGGAIAIENLEKVIEYCFNSEYGDLSRISSVGIDSNYNIIINGEIFQIANTLNLEESVIARLCPNDRRAIQDGKWGSLFGFGSCYQMPNLVEIDLVNAPKEIINNARREFRISKGHWGNLFRRKSKLPALEIVKLPEGDVTKESSSIWNKFKSDKDYDNAVEQATQTSDVGANMSDIVNKIGTVKDLVWSKPLPRMFVKTFGYGVGVPAYWGLMTALGPFGVLMGALGVGALAHYEVKHYKETGGL